MEFDRDWIAQAIAIAHQFPINENHHVLPNPALLVEDVSARLLVIAEVVIENRAER